MLVLVYHNLHTNYMLLVKYLQVVVLLVI
jgi:hypothetical protein